MDNAAVLLAKFVNAMTTDLQKYGNGNVEEKIEKKMLKLIRMEMTKWK